MNDIHSRQKPPNRRVYVTPRLTTSTGIAIPNRITRSVPWSPTITMSARNPKTAQSTMPKTCARRMYGKLSWK